MEVVLWVGYVVVEGAGEALRWRYRRRRVFEKLAWRWKKNEKVKTTKVVWETEGWKGREEREKTWCRRRMGRAKKWGDDEQGKKARAAARKEARQKYEDEKRVRVPEKKVKKKIVKK